MRIYEITLILKPQLSDVEVAEFVEKTKKLISQDGGGVISEEKMGRRKLSHEIGHVREGFYIYMKFRTGASSLQKLEQNLKLNEMVLRSFVVRSLDKEIAKPAVK